MQVIIWGALPSPTGGKTETCNHVFDKFLAHCAMRVEMDDMAFSTLEGYREILDVIVRPQIGTLEFEQVVYSQLAAIVSAHTKGKMKKTYNNVASAARTAFKFGYKDRPGKFNPALALETFRITEKDRPKVDPFAIQEADTIIAACHRIHGEWYGNYEEFGFFTGMRQSEQFALEVATAISQKARSASARPWSCRRRRIEPRPIRTEKSTFVRARSTYCGGS